MYGQQFVSGVDPTLLCLMEKVPPNMPLTEHLMEGLLGRDVSLSQALKDKRMFLVNCDVLEGIPMNSMQDRGNSPLHASAGMAVFVVEQGSGDLLPVAIQLGQVTARMRTYHVACGHAHTNARTHN